MTIHLESHLESHSYKCKKKKEIPIFIEPEINLKNRTLKQQSGGATVFRANYTPGKVTSGSKLQTARQQRVTAILAVKVKRATEQSKLERASGQREILRVESVSRRLNESKELFTKEALKKAEELNFRKREKTLIKTSDFKDSKEVLSDFTRQELSNTDIRKRITDAQLKVIAQRAASRELARQRASLNRLSSEARTIAEAMINDAGATIRSQRNIQQVTAMIVQLQAECTTIIIDAAIKSLSYASLRNSSKLEIDLIKPKLEQAVRDTNDTATEYQKTVLKSYIDSDGVSKQIQAIDIEIGRVKSVIAVATTRLEEISNTPIPDPVDLQPFRDAIDSTKNDRDNFVPNQSPTYPTREIVDSIARKINNVYSDILGQINDIDINNTSDQSRIDNATAIIKDTAANKASAKSAFENALSSAQSGTLDPATRQQYSEFISSHDKDISDSAEIQIKINDLLPIQPTLTNMLPQVNKSAVNKAYNDYKSAIEYRDSLSVKQPYPEPQKPANITSIEALPTINPYTNKRDDIRNTEIIVSNVKSSRDTAKTNYETASDINSNTSLIPLPTRDNINTEVGKYKTEGYKYSSALRSLRETNQTTLKAMLSGARDAFKNRKNERKTDKVTKKQNAANMKLNIPSRTTGEIRNADSIRTEMRQTVKKANIVSRTNEGYKAIIGILSRATTEGTSQRPPLENGDAINLKGKINEIRNESQPTLESEIGGLNDSIQNPPVYNAVMPNRTALDNATTKLSDANTSKSELNDTNVALTMRYAGLLPKYRVELSSVITQRFKREQQGKDYTTAMDAMRSKVSDARAKKLDSYRDMITYKSFAQQAIRRPVRTNFNLRFQPNSVLLREKRKSAESEISTALANKKDSSKKLDLAIIKKFETRYSKLKVPTTVKLDTLSKILSVKRDIENVNTDITSIKDNDADQTTPDLPDLTDAARDLQNKKDALDNATREISERSDAEATAQTSLVSHLQQRIQFNTYFVVGGIKPIDTTILQAYNRARDAFKEASDNAGSSRNEYSVRAQGVKSSLPAQREAARDTTIDGETMTKPIPPDKTELDAIKQEIADLTADNIRLSERVQSENGAKSIIDVNAQRVLTTAEYVNIVSKPLDSTNKDSASRDKDSAYRDAEAVKRDLDLIVSNKLKENADMIRDISNLRDGAIRDIGKLKDLAKLNMYDKDGSLKKILQDIRDLEGIRRKLDDAIAKLNDTIARIEKDLLDPTLDDAYREKLRKDLEALKKLREELNKRLEEVNKKIKERQNEVDRLRREIDELNRLRKELKENQKPFLPFVAVIGVLGVLGGLPFIPGIPKNPFGGPPKAPEPVYDPPEEDSTTTVDETNNGRRDGCNDGIKQGEIDGAAAGLAEVKRQYEVWLANNKNPMLTFSSSSNSETPPENSNSENPPKYYNSENSSENSNSENSPENLNSENSSEN